MLFLALMGMPRFQNFSNFGGNVVEGAIDGTDVQDNRLTESIASARE